VIECRPKRAYNIPRQVSTPVTSNEKIINRNASNRSSHHHHHYHRKLKQKSTQTEIYDEFYMSDDSITSNEENNRYIVDTTPTRHSYIYDSTTSSSNKSSSYHKSEQSSGTLSSTTSRRNRDLSNNYGNNSKKLPKRRKSLPSQYSIADEQPISNPISLIPRGPLICSNMDNLDNWLPERLFYSQTPQLKNNNNSLDSCNTITTNSGSILTANSSENLNSKTQALQSVSVHKTMISDNSSPIPNKQSVKPLILKSTLSPTGYVSRSPYINKELNLNDFFIDTKLMNKVKPITPKPHPITIEAPKLNVANTLFSESQLISSSEDSKSSSLPKNNITDSDENSCDKIKQEIRLDINSSKIKNQNEDNLITSSHITSKIMTSSSSSINESINNNNNLSPYKVRMNKLIKIPTSNNNINNNNINRKRVQSDCCDINYLIDNNLLYHSIDEEVCSSDSEDQELTADVLKKLKEAELVIL
jgi:hypothetical protein